MDRRGLILTVVLAFFGCELEERQAPPLRVSPPSGNGTIGADGGVQRTLFRPLQTLRYGEQVSGVVQPDTLMGYVFHGTADDLPTVTLTLEGEGVTLLALYGPQSSSGRWGDAIAVAHHEDLIELSPEGLPGTGAYFLLVRSLRGEGDRYTLTLECDGCEASDCAEFDPCDTYCPAGRQTTDDASCFLCECAEADDACTDEMGCATGEICQRGRCVDAVTACIRSECDDRRMEVCGVDGTGYPNACWARCHGVEFMPGACACAADTDCADGHRCVEGQCRPPDCSHCAGSVEPVCGTRRGTYQNECFLECAGDTFLHRGECVRERCQSNEECLENQQCLPYRDRDVPGNARACAQDIEGPNCIRHCVGRPDQPIVFCRPDSPCPADEEQCFPLGPERGVCVRGCRIDATGAGRSSCPGRTVCAAIQWSEGQRGRGICLPSCGSCQRIEGVECLPDIRGREVCQSCNCDVLPEDPVCSGAVRYRNACEALCDGRTRLNACPMVGPAPGCDCTVDWAPLCVNREIFANQCEARCAERQGMAMRFTQCLQPPEVRDAVQCRGDDDCQNRICGGLLCGSRDVADCNVRLSPMAACISRTSGCTCNNGICGFSPTDESAQCRGVAPSDRPEEP